MPLTIYVNKPEENGNEQNRIFAQQLAVPEEGEAYYKCIGAFGDSRPSSNFSNYCFKQPWARSVVVNMTVWQRFALIAKVIAPVYDKR